MQKTDREAIVSLGRIYCDFVFTGLDGMPRLGRELFAEEMTLAAGGGAFITAAHGAALGRPTALVARLGTDALSQAIEPQLALPGIDLQFLDRHPSAGPQVTVVMVEGKDRAFLSRRAGPAEPATLAAALSWPMARHLHIAEYATLAEMHDVVRQAKERGLSVSLDPSWDDTLIRDPSFLDRCAGVDVFLPNLEEARVLTGREPPEEALQALSARFPLVALKLGAEGGMLSVGGEVCVLPARKVRVVDTTGAGDAFNAGLLDAWLDGRSLEACLSAAIAAGTRSVQAAGGAAAVSSSVRAS
ncbi:carbohydrate kinase family protein [Chelativorans salis]|uniref:Sugar kinase n=1 Tax=Chelativorans salis TaxID=2978478 RepID=A0ABT2LIC2_9HYPH|nr:sugar kinase [Chelativorans sp. EGI FJ00035]MCT7374320.1 sugar kinase [Chelativorans sp. EGI FJ00035]